MLGAPGVLGDLDRLSVRRTGQQTRGGEQHPARVVRHLQRHGRDLRTGRLQQHRATVRAELLRHGRQLRGDHLAQLRVRLQDRGQRLDLAVQLGPLVLQLDPVEAGEPAQRGVQDVLRLDLAQREVRHQTLLRLRGVVAVPDDPDDLVDVEERDEEALDQVQPVAALGAAELAAPAHHLEAVVEVDLQQLLEAQGERLAVDQRHVVDAEGLLHRRQLVELLQHRFRNEAVLHLDDQTQPVRPVGQVLDVGDALELLRRDQVLDLGDHLLRADGEGEFGDDEALAPGRHVLHGDGGADLERAPAPRVRVLDPAEPHDAAAGGQVGAGDEPHQRLDVGARVLDQVPGGGDDLAQIVRRHVGGHAHGDPGHPVDQEVGVGGREDDRLALLAVVVRLEVDGVLVDRLGHQRGRVGHPALGVPHGGRRVVVAERAEVAVTVDQGQPHREGLRHPHERVVDRGVAVRVQLAHHLADDTGALHIAPVGPQAHLVHLGHDAPVHRLHAVAGVGQGPGVDHRVRVLEEGTLHFVDDVDVEDLLLEVVRRRGLRATAGHRGCDSFTDSVRAT